MSSLVSISYQDIEAALVAGQEGGQRVADQLDVRLRERRDARLH